MTVSAQAKRAGQWLHNVLIGTLTLTEVEALCHRLAWDLPHEEQACRAARAGLDGVMQRFTEEWSRMVAAEPEACGPTLRVPLAECNAVDLCGVHRSWNYALLDLKDVWGQEAVEVGAKARAAVRRTGAAK